MYIDRGQRENFRFSFGDKMQVIGFGDRHLLPGPCVLYL